MRSLAETVALARDIYRSEGLRPLVRATRDGVKARYRELSARVTRARHRLRYGDASPEPYELIHVDPDDITYCVVPEMQSRFDPPFGTYVVDGEWDAHYAPTGIWYPTDFEDRDTPLLAKFEQFALHVSLLDHFECGTPWHDTEWYRWIESRPGYGTHYSDAEATLERFSEVEELYEHIERHGYRTQRELVADERSPFSASTKANPEFHEVIINVGRDGELIFDDGRHRLSIAKILGLETIPVRVLVRHERWQALRHEIANATRIAELGSRAKRHLDHPDMEDVISPPLQEAIVS